jgi:hypothetical protein
MSSSIIPNTYFFDFSFCSPKMKSVISIDGDLSDWDSSFLIPDLMHLINQKPFADVYFTWNYDNLYIGLNVTNKSTPVDADPMRFWTKDCIEIWFDLRNEKPVRRYTEHCHHFYFIPVGNKTDKQLATAGECREPGSSIQETIHHHEELEVASVISQKGYSLEARIPRSVIPTFDPVNYPMIGFNYHVNSTDRKAQWWSCGTDFPRHLDPSTWGSIELVETIT